MRWNYVTGAALAVALGLSGVAAQAETYRAATWNGANSANDKFLQDFASQVKEKSNGEMEFEIYPGGSLLPAKGTLEGIQQGVAQFANITATYIPAKMPWDFVTADQSFMSDDQMALAFAKTEVTFFNPKMQEELKKLDIVFGSGFSIGVYNFICSFDAKSLDDLKGKKIRTSSDAQVDFVKEVGGVAVSAPANEIYTGIQRGTLDCTAGTPLFLTDYFKLSEVAKSVLQLPMGSNANGGYYFNKEFWKSRTPEQRRILLDSLSKATAREMVDWAGNVDNAWKTSKEAGVALNKPSDADVAKLAAFRKKFMSGLAEKEMKNQGISDPTELINQFSDAIAKWTKLLDGIDRTNVDQVADLLNKEIYSKIDVNSYGLN